jgi:hypothetical protein
MLTPMQLESCHHILGATPTKNDTAEVILAPAAEAAAAEQASAPAQAPAQEAAAAMGR